MCKSTIDRGPCPKCALPLQIADTWGDDVVYCLDCYRVGLVGTSRWVDGFPWCWWVPIEIDRIRKSLR